MKEQLVTSKSCFFNHPSVHFTVLKFFDFYFQVPFCNSIKTSCRLRFISEHRRAEIVYYAPRGRKGTLLTSVRFQYEPQAGA